MNRELIVVGGGGHAKVVVATARAAGWVVRAIADDDRARWGQELLGVAIDRDVASVLGDVNATCVLAIGDNATRHRLARGSRCQWATLVHPGAIVHESVQLGDGCVVFAGAVVQPDTSIGAHGIVNTGASIDHDGAIGVAVHVAPGARLAGGVALGDEVFVGIGAVIVPNRKVGARSIVGAGAAVVRDVPESCVAVGVPARSRPR